MMTMIAFAMPGTAELLILAVLVGVPLAIIVALVCFVLIAPKRRSHGFEVTPTTGDRPVLKEEDHG